MNLSINTHDENILFITLILIPKKNETKHNTVSIDNDFNYQEYKESRHDFYLT